MQGKGRMKRRRYEVEGAVRDIPLRWKERAGTCLEQYPDFEEPPVYTPQGEPLRLTCDDACPDAVLPDNSYRECGSCQLFRLHSESLLGVCGHPAHRRKETTEEETL